MQFGKNLFILLLGIIFVSIPFLTSGQACAPCVIDSDCASGFVCRNNCCAKENQISVSVSIPYPWTPFPFVKTRVSFEGKAYPGAFLTLLKDNEVAGTFLADDAGLFKKDLVGLSGGKSTFGIFADDTEGRTSVTSNITIEILAGAVTKISGLFLAPTISLNPSQVERGDKINITGQSFPESTVHIFIFSPEIVRDVTASKEGKWQYQLDTSFLEERDYNVRAKAFYGEGEQSEFSDTLSFSVLPKKKLICQPPADLNVDGKVNIFDFSILLYYWGQKMPANPCADINSDEIVDIVDFSIMMYYWTG